ncbi:Cytosolic carboxypeptidase 6-like 2 [Homarus americanus]|uniref:Cytosolic carboxypeptidase 6-like 2 n=1 Tax=Homarus americanus TaxID=6706 RepID=A0A8J5TKA4_HOMAM|nr:Cytosolic carboxypeptidase 6-like 2 [Homarus americanus]
MVGVVVCGGWRGPGMTQVNPRSLSTGNLGRIDFAAEYDYDLFIRPDTCNPRCRLWFNFTVDNAKADQVRV